VARELCRILSAVARYLSDPAAGGRVEVISGTEGSAADHAAAGLREAVCLAAASIGAAEGHLGGPGARSDPVAGHLAAAADALNAGSDLMDTHFLPGLDGILAERSDWARLIASAPLTSALQTEMAWWTARAASWVDWLASQAPDYARTELSAAQQWLTAAHVLTPPSGKADPDAVMGEHLLYDVPLATPPGRRIPDGNESPGRTVRGDHGQRRPYPCSRVRTLQAGLFGHKRHRSVLVSCGAGGCHRVRPCHLGTAHPGRPGGARRPVRGI